jgi:hypothetical protein
MYYVVDDGTNLLSTLITIRLLRVTNALLLVEMASNVDHQPPLGMSSRSWFSVGQTLQQF